MMMTYEGITSRGATDGRSSHAVANFRWRSSSDCAAILATPTSCPQQPNSDATPHEERSDMGVQTFLLELGINECERLLAAASLGRLGVIVDGRPAIFPVNHVFDP